MNNVANLHAAGTKPLLTKPTLKKRVDNLTTKLKSMVAYLGDSSLLTKLSRELFYHKLCYVQYSSKYNSAKSFQNMDRSSSQDNDFEFPKALCFLKVLDEMDFCLDHYNYVRVLFRSL